MTTTTETATVHSSHGEFVINRRTGEVIEAEAFEPGDPEAAFIFEIARFDMEENARFWRQTPGEMDAYDILDLGWWNKDGSYSEPEHDWRKEARLQSWLNKIEDTQRWPENTTPEDRQALIAGGYAHEEDGEVWLTSLGEMEIGNVPVTREDMEVRATASTFKLNPNQKHWARVAGVNAAMIARQFPEECDVLPILGQISEAAANLCEIEAEPCFNYEETRNDWESVCKLIADHICRMVEAPDAEAIRKFINAEE